VTDGVPLDEPGPAGAEGPAAGHVPAVGLRGIVKTFGGFLALDHVDLDLAPGEVHALLGENGAGKTTLMNVLAGLYRADEGTIEIDGAPAPIHSPGSAIAAGVGMVHQHFKLVGPMTVAENVHLGWSETAPVLSRKVLVARTRELSERFGLPVDPEALVWQLSVGEQQRVEILRILARGVRILVLDEPTAVLAEAETEELFGVLRRLVAEGHTVVFISHKLREVMAVSDRVTVLRAGSVVGTFPRSEVSVQRLAQLMTGESVAVREVEHREPTGDPVLQCWGVWAKGDRGLDAVKGVDLTVYPGEVVGIAGVSGNGQSELLEVIAGLRRCESGQIQLQGEVVTGASAIQMCRRGVGHIPEDRLRSALVPSASVRHNAILRMSRSRELGGRFTLNPVAVRRRAQALIERGRVQLRDGGMPISQLSGGNQQRLVARREAEATTCLLLASQPTRGLDVQAAQDVRSLVLDVREQGAGVLLVSDDLDELLQTVDRLVVIYAGEIVGRFDGTEIDRHAVGLLMGGHVDEVQVGA
jgi:general nucleoside transport system ATP-binding protein